MKPLSVHEIRQRYLDFFGEREHSIIPSASLLPENDPTTLFTGSGMQPLLPYLLGEPHAKGNRLTNSQLCFRSEDIEEIGDNRHTTFFEMLGNWSLGDYFKSEQVSWLWEFLTNSTTGLGLDPEKLYVTVFAGASEHTIERDVETAALWQSLFENVGLSAPTVSLGSEHDAATKGMQGGRIFFYDAAKNWWSRAGVPEKMPPGEPGGPDTEVFFDFGTPHDPAYGEHCHPNCDCGRFMEIGNSVFMQFVKEADGGFKELPQKNVDFGGGLERMTAAVANNPDVFQIDTLAALINSIENHAAKPYSDPEAVQSYRIIADHIRAAVFMISAGAEPSNTDQGYFTRRLIRRAVRHTDALALPEDTLASLAVSVADAYGTHYPALATERDVIAEKIRTEEKRFRKTLSAGLKQFAKLASTGATLSGQDAFTLFTSFGFPLDMTLDLAEEKGIQVDTKGFEVAFAEHQATSRAGAEKKFKGGLADHSAASVRYHTATHLLHQALQNILGPSAQQRGSNITPERLRFDFTHPTKLTEEELAAVTTEVNAQIAAGLSVEKAEMSVAEARKAGALGLFEDRYADTVNVYTIGDYSIEICGGPHVSNTQELGTFRITKEESAGASIRRIKAVLE